jgi:hypothetical protein
MRTSSRLTENCRLHFEANHGQTDEAVRFLSRGSGYSLNLTASEAVLVLEQLDPERKPNPNAKRDAHITQAPREAKAQGTAVALRMSLIGAARKPLVSGREELPGKANYFIGSDPAKWRTNVPTYAKVHYQNVYPGIDLLYYGNQRQLEYDFTVAPGADPNKIVLDFKGADKIEIDAQGELVLHAAGGDIRQRKPVIYQEINGARHEIDGDYVLKGANRVSFHVAAYDTSRPLIIDPVVLSYSTYLGGSGGDQGYGIAVDANGNAYVTGITASTNFPTTPGVFQLNVIGGPHVFVTKLNPSGSALVYSTYLGGSGLDYGVAVDVDATGNAYVTGYTLSKDFPTLWALQPINLDSYDAFVTKLNPTGSALVYSTYLGGGSSDFGLDIAVDATGNTYVSGEAGANFPTTPGAFQSAFAGGPYDAFVTKLNPSGSALVYSTYLGGGASAAGGFAL